MHIFRDSLSLTVFYLCLISLAGLSACSDSSDSISAQAASQSRFQGEWHEHNCQMTIPEGRSEGDFRCGTFVVPANWDSPEDGTRSFEVAVLKARDGTSKSEPVVFFGGGPGAWNLEGYIASPTPTALLPLNEKRDIIFFDKRGGGLSEPNLFCPEYFDQFLQAYSVIADGKADADALLAGLQACHMRLTGNGIDVSHYNSYQIAADIAALMRELAYETYNLYGVSYGGVEVQVMMREHPEAIRSVVMDSPGILERRVPSGASFERSLDILFSSCDASISCSTLYPDLRANLIDVVNQLNDTTHYSPVILPDGATQDVYVTGDRFLVGLRQALYRSDLIPLLPQFIASTAAGNMSLLDIFVPQLLQTGGYDWGLYAATLCAEQVPFYDAQSIADSRQQLNPLLADPAYYISGYLRRNMCDDWQVAMRPDIEIKLVISDIPALVLSGEFDPATPPSNGEKVSSALSKSQYFLFRGLGHGVLRGDTAEVGQLSCAQKLLIQFLDEPESIVDGSCVKELPGAFD